MKYFYTTTSTSTTTTLTAAPSVAVNHLVIDLFSADQGRFGQILKWSFIQCPQQQQPNPVQWSRCKRGGGCRFSGTVGSSPSFRQSVQMRSLNHQWLVRRVKVWLVSAVTPEQPWWSKELQHANIINPRCSLYCISGQNKTTPLLSFPRGRNRHLFFSVKKYPRRILKSPLSATENNE